MHLGNSELYTGTQVNYYVICPTKLWYFSHFIQMEKTSDLVSMGRVIHETTYKKDKKEISVDNKISVDFIKRGDTLVLHEVKKSRKMENAHVYQLLYYLYFLEKKGVKASGVIDYPSIRETRKVELTPDNKGELEDILSGITEIISMDKPPERKRKRICPRCSYFELCWIN